MATCSVRTCIYKSMQHCGSWFGVTSHSFPLFRKRKQTETPADKHGTWPPGARCSSPSPDVYKVIRRQHDTDVSDNWPHTKNTSFLGSSPDTPTDEYDNLGGHDTESGFVTLASTESGFVTNDLYESYQNRSSTRYPKEHSWLDNELYSYWRRLCAFRFFVMKEALGLESPQTFQRTK